MELFTRMMSGCAQERRSGLMRPPPLGVRGVGRRSDSILLGRGMLKPLATGTHRSISRLPRARSTMLSFDAERRLWRPHGRIARGRALPLASIGQVRATAGSCSASTGVAERKTDRYCRSAGSLRPGESGTEVSPGRGPPRASSGEKPSARVLRPSRSGRRGLLVAMAVA
jgi:hypothetical protein